MNSPSDGEKQSFAMEPTTEKLADFSMDTLYKHVSEREPLSEIQCPADIAKIREDHTTFKSAPHADFAASAKLTFEPELAISAQTFTM